MSGVGGADVQLWLVVKNVKFVAWGQMLPLVVNDLKLLVLWVH